MRSASSVNYLNPQPSERASVEPSRALPFADYHLFWHNPVAILVLPLHSFQVATANHAATQLFDCALDDVSAWDLELWLEPESIAKVSKTLWDRPNGDPSAMATVQLRPACSDQRLSLLATNLNFGSGADKFWAIFCDRRLANTSVADAVWPAHPLSLLIHSLPFPAWTLSSDGNYDQKSPLVSSLPRCLRRAGCGCSLDRIQAAGCAHTPGDQSNRGLPRQAEVLACNAPRETLVSLGSCGTWRIVLFPVQQVQGSRPPLVGGAAFNLTEQVASRATADRYLAQLCSQAKEFQTIREQERQDIAREIHDSLGQEVTFLRLGFSHLRREAVAQGKDMLPPKFLEQLRALEHQVDVVTRASRRISFDLRPDVVETAGLADAAHNLVLEVRRRLGIRGQLEIAGNWQNPPVEMGIYLYRCLQELLNNMAKHARANNFVVRLMLQDHTYQLEVMDNGVGLPRAFVTGSKPDTPIGSRGLRGLYERVAVYDGKVTLITRPEYDGTLVKLDFPISTAERPDAQGNFG